MINFQYMETGNQKPWRVPDEQPIEDRLTKYLELVSNTKRKIPSLVVDDADLDAVISFFSREEILAILDEQNRELMIFSPIQERFKGKLLLVLRFKNPQEARAEERTRKIVAREEVEKGRAAFLQMCWDKSAWVAEV